MPSSDRDVALRVARGWLDYATGLVRLADDLANDLSILERRFVREHARIKSEMANDLINEMSKVHRG